MGEGRTNGAASDHIVTASCPRCSKPVPWVAESKFRPFCSERCKQIDFGSWASEEYAIPAAESPSDDTSEEES